MAVHSVNYQFPQDTPAASTDRGTVALVRRADANGTLVTADGDYSAMQVDADGDLRVTDDDGTTQLVAINAELDAQTALLTTIETDLDDVNSELDAHTTLLTTIEGDLDLVNAELDAQTTLLTHIDGDLHTLITQTDGVEGSLSTLVTQTDGIEASLTSIDASLNDIETVMENGVAGTLNNGTQVTTAGAAAVSLIAANSARKSLIIQNVGLTGNVRVGQTGVTTTTGFRLAPGERVSFSMPFCPTNQIFIIRESAINVTILAQEVV